MISDGQWDSVFGLGFGRLQGSFSADVVDMFQSIRFIGQCLKSSVIAKGFQTTFHASKFSNSSSSYLADIQKACTGFSKNIMRSTIRAMSTKRNQLDRDISACRSELKRNCPAVLVQSIRSKIRELNSKIHHCLQQTKSNKFVQLTGAPSSTSIRDPPNTVVTIPSDLPLTAAEKSVLSKGLNLFHSKRNPTNSAPNSTPSNFFDAFNSNLFFMTNKTLETQKKTNLNPSPNANLIGLHPKANLVPSTFSLENAGMIFENLISAKRSNSPISLPMSGRHSNHFAVIRT